MSDLSDEDVKKLAFLCRIACSEEDVASIKGHLSRIINYVEQLNAIPTDHIAGDIPFFYEHKLPLREDVADNSLSREAFLSNCPSHVGGLVKVPPILKPIN